MWSASWEGLQLLGSVCPLCCTPFSSSCTAAVQHPCLISSVSGAYFSGACMDPEDQLAKEEAEEAEEMKDIDCNEEGGVGAGASGVGAETSTGSAGGPSSVTSPQVRRGSISGPSRTEARFSGKEMCVPSVELFFFSFCLVVTFLKSAVPQVLLPPSHSTTACQFNAK